ncbi:hypothetical protein KEM55_000007 [Ascosphaera atra]|nr:hypothetical protein KEM55_000007 [Ascosphaera atra]
MLPRIAFLASLSGVLAQGLQYDVTQTAPFDASKIASNAPIGVSLEFFEFPDYMQKLPLTKACLRKLGEAMGASPPLRIGGTSQDAAVFNTSLAPEISYRWPDDSHKGVPLDLQFGTKFVDLAASYDGSVTFGKDK